MSEAVLITRPEPRASQTATLVSAMGLTPIVAPVMRVEPRPLRTMPPNIAAILLSSGNAIDALPATSRSHLVLAVGDATARAAREAGFHDVTSADGDAAALVELVRRRVGSHAGGLLLVTGRGQGGALATALRHAGYRVVRRVVYETLPVRDLPESARAALTAGRRLTVLLFSSETARHFIRLVHRAGLVGCLAHCAAVTISAGASMALRDVTWARVSAADRPTQDAMLALLR